MLDALCHKQMEGCFVSSGGLGMEMHVSLCFPVGTLSLQQFPSRLQSQIAGQGVLVQQLWTEKWLVVLRTAERTPSVWALQEKEACAMTGQPIDDGRLCTPTLPGAHLISLGYKVDFQGSNGLLGVILTSCWKSTSPGNCRAMSALSFSAACK